MGQVFLVGHHPKDAKKLEKIFLSVGVSCDLIPKLETATDKLDTNPPVLLVVEKQEQLGALYTLQSTLKAKSPTTPFLVTLPSHDVASAVEAMNAGAFDCVSKPYNRNHMLAAAKRATSHQRRTLFVAKVSRPRKKPLRTLSAIAVSCLILVGVIKWRAGPPPSVINLGSAHLSGIQWQERDLWVGDWYDSVVTVYRAQKSFRPKKRELKTEVINRMRDGQPILICNTPEALVSIGSNLSIRSHHRSIELPTLHSKQAPGNKPTGLAWDGKNIWSTDSGTNLVYRHGPDLSVFESRKSLIHEPKGLAYDGSSFWVLGTEPLRVAQMQPLGDSFVWRGPYLIPNLLAEDVIPSGFSVGFNRFWFVSGGDPKLVSVPVRKVLKTPQVSEGMSRQGEG